MKQLNEPLLSLSQMRALFQVSRRRFVLRMTTLPVHSLTKWQTEHTMPASGCQAWRIRDRSAQTKLPLMKALLNGGGSVGPAAQKVGAEYL